MTTRTLPNGPDGGGRCVFLTGATGFIGKRLAAALAARGDRLRCLVRDTRAAHDLEVMGAQLIQGDITDDTALQYGLDHADLAYHLAAIFDFGRVDAGAMERVNVDGTRAFLLVAQSMGVPRLVYVSSTAALVPAVDGEQEDTRESDGPYPSIYHRTKAHAHRIARKAQQRGLPLIIACPAAVYGPGERGPNGRLIVDLIRRRVPALFTNPGWYSYVHVDDVVRALVALGERGAIGETYVLSGEATSINDFAERVASEAGVRAPPLRLPAPLIRATAAVLDPISRLTRLRFPINRESVETSTYRWVHAHTRATRDLGWTPRSLEDGLPETVAWYKDSLKK